jgi:hypothetical protein
MKTTSCYRSIFVSAVCVPLFLAGAGDALAQHIEQIMRDYQARYHLVTQGGWLTWPSCTASGSPAPHFPKDGFYGDISQDPDAGVRLVGDLVAQFYGTAEIYTSFVNAPSGLSGLQGATSIDNFQPGELVSPGTVTAANYAVALLTVASHIAKLNMVQVQASQVIASGEADSRVTRSVAAYDYYMSCSEQQQCAMTHNSGTAWGHYLFVGNGAACQNTGDFTIPQLGVSFTSVARVLETATIIDDQGTGYTALVRNTRGKIQADLTPYKNGTATVLLKLRRIAPSESVYCLSGFFGSCASYFAQTGPVSAGEGGLRHLGGRQSPVGLAVDHAELCRLLRRNAGR